jgi:CO/xanthine dehydrogenase Mo-binding subunit
MSYQAVGKPLPRLEGADKVTGKTQFAADFLIPGALWGKVLRSSVPHARLVRIDVSKARRVPGVSAILTGQDLPPVLVGLRMKDMPVLARERVRYVGEPIAAVAAETTEVAEEALGLIEVEYEEIPALFDSVEAIKPGAPLIHDNPGSYKNAPPRDVDLSNLQSLTIWKNGGLEAGFQQADRIFEHTFHTPLTHHGYLEPHACTVRIDPDGQVEIWASNKAPFSLRDRLAADLGIARERIKVHILSVGGDFGGKASLVDAAICYFLAERSRKPVKMVLSYTEELAAAAHRHPAVITLRTGVRRDGTLTAIEAKIIFSGGAYAAFKANPEVSVMGGRRLASYYRVPAIHVETYCAYTNQVSCTQARTPGSPQIVFAVESQMDLIARELGLDPVEFRMRNLLDDGDAAPLGQKWQHILVRETLRKAVEASGWRRSRPGKYRGRGVALYERGAGGGKAGAAVRIDAEGKVAVFIGTPDVGPGIHTVVQQIVGETLGIAPERIQVKGEDTDTSPWDPGTGGSKSTNATGHAAHQAACEVREKLLSVAARKLGCKPEEIRRSGDRYLGPKRKAVSFAELARLAVKENGGPIFHHLKMFEPSHHSPVTGFAAQVAEVEVNPETGQVRVDRVTTVHDTGTVLNTLTYQGQVDGGVVMGLGYALMEENPMVDGRITTLNLGDFKIPTTRDIPSLKTVFLKSSAGPVPYQGKAVGEIPNVPTAAAIANAVADAIGVRLFDLPLTAEKVWRALKGGV